MGSIFDSPRFLESLFFPVAEDIPPPPEAQDRLFRVHGEMLRVRHHVGHGSNRTIFLFPGNGGSAASFDDLAPMFLQRGFDLAVADYRGYGKSSGTPTLRACLSDVRPLFDAFLGIEPALPVTLMGYSLGTLAVAELYPDPPAGVDSFIYLSGLSSLSALLARRGLGVPDAFTEDEIETFDPIPKLRKGRAPILVLHGLQDTVVLSREGYEAFMEAGGKDKTISMLPGGHGGLFELPQFWTALKGFFKGLEPPAPTT